MIPQSPAVIANTIRMTRSQHAGPFLVVEGRDDRLLLEHFILRKDCNVVVAEGKKNVCEVMGILNETKFAGVLCVIDADFDRVEGKGICSPNIVRPQFHDLDTMLMCSPALTSAIVEFGSENKVAGFHQDVLERLLERALLVACLRLYSQRKGLDLKFTGITYTAWINPSSFEASVNDLVKEVRNQSQRRDLTIEAMVAGIQEVAASNPDPREMCVGSDLIELLSIGLRRVLGTNRALPVNGEALRHFMRGAYSEQYFANSSLCAEIRQWETSNESFQVLRI